MNNNKNDKTANPGLRFRQLLRQEITLKQAVAIGSAFTALAFVLLIMFNVMQREESKAVTISETGNQEKLQTTTNLLKNTDVSPNPFDDSFTAKFESLTKEEVTIQLADINGKIIYRENIFIEKGMNVYRYTPVKKLASGTYVFRIINNNSILFTAKLVCRNS
jgi:hypothetical protein